MQCVDYYSTHTCTHALLLSSLFHPTAVQYSWRTWGRHTLLHQTLHVMTSCACLCIQKQQTKPAVGVAVSSLSRTTPGIQQEMEY